MGQLRSLWLAGAICVVVSQPAWAQTVQVSAIQINQTDSGIQVLLPGAGIVPSQVATKSSGNDLIIYISNSQLRLPTGNTYRQENPTDDIVAVTANNINATSIRVTITAKSTAPKAQVAATPQGLVLTVTSATAPAETDVSQTPDDEVETDAQGTDVSQTPDNEVEADADAEEEIEIVVTATRTLEALADISRSVTVVDEEEIEKQTAISRDLGEILGRKIPGFGVGNQSLSEFGQTLRGRNPLVLIDGVPQSTNRNAARNLRSIDPGVIERVEVLRGPTALYGDGATGGIINIITRSGEEGPPQYRISVGGVAALDPLDESLGGNIQLQVSGKEGISDYLLSGSFETIGGLFDAQGDRIPPDLLSSQGSLADTNTVNLFGKFGWDFNQHRLELSLNHFDTDQDTDFATDPAVNAFPPGTQKATTREGLRLEDQSAVTNTFVNLDYSHPNLLFGSRVHAQVYYRDYLTRFFPFDGAAFNRRTAEGFRIFQSRVESQKYGARLEVDTPLVADKLSLLSGLDFSDEDAVQPVAIFDSTAYDSSRGLVYNRIGDRPWVPPLSQTNLGLFTQLRWQPIDQLVLRGGVRHEQVGVNVDDFTTLTGRRIEGGELDYDATLFNIGAVYNLTDEISVFADFAQGFSIADVGLILRDATAGVSVAALNPEAQRVDSYEIGVRGEWEKLQASLALFYNDSDLGTTFDRNTLAVIRAPEKIYGVEAALDMELSEQWSIGSTFSFVEGENDVNEDEQYLALNGFRIPPIKITAYVENETAPGWLNRLQLLYSGNRDRAFDDAVDFRDVDSYVTLDLISSIQLGSGTLRLGIQNLLDNQYFTPASQLLRLRTNDSYTAAPGRTISLQYLLEF